MLYSGTDPESSITKFTLENEEKPSFCANPAEERRSETLTRSAE